MNKKNNYALLWKYLSLGTQIIVALGAAVYFGIKIDQWLNFKMPLAVWVLPLFIITLLIYKVIKDTAPKK